MVTKINTSSSLIINSFKFNYSLNTLPFKKVEGVQLKSILEFIAPIGEIPDASKYASSEDLKSDKLDLTINHLNIDFSIFHSLPFQ